MEYEIKVKLRSNNNALDCTYNWMIKHGIWNKSEITFKQQFIGLHI